MCAGGGEPRCGKEGKMKKETVLQVVKGVILAYAVSAVVLLVLAFLLFQWDVSEGVVRGYRASVRADIGFQAVLT